MTKHNQKLLALAAIASIGLSASTAFAQTKDTSVIVDGKGEIPYAIDSSKAVTRSGAGLCWRTGYWNAAAAENAPAGEFPVGCGCDGDVVPKAKCEATPVAQPEPPKTEVIPERKITEEKVRLNADVLFDFGKDTLKPEGRAALQEVVRQAQGLKIEVIIVTGHTDRIGGDVPNQRLSERRALSVKNFMASQGIGASYIATEGKGKRQPTAETEQCSSIKARKSLIDCLQPDRRVEIEIIGTR